MHVRLIRTLNLSTCLSLLSAKRKSTLIFCVNINHVMALTKTFRGHGIDARFVYSDTPTAERKGLIASFKAGEFPVLINCGMQKRSLPDDYLDAKVQLF